MADPATSTSSASEYEDDENECDLDYYADHDDCDDDGEQVTPVRDQGDPEAFRYECLTKEKATVIVEEIMEKSSQELKVLMVSFDVCLLCPHMRIMNG